MSEMSVSACIIGGGSIGGIIAHYLYKGGLSRIPIYYRSEESYRKILGTRSINIVMPSSSEAYAVPVEPRLTSVPWDECDFIFNTVKAYDVESTIELMKRLSRKDTVIVMLQNGFGSYELVSERIQEAKIAVGVAYIGAERLDASTIKYNGGKTVIAGCPGKPCHELSPIATVLTRGGMDFRITSNVEYYRWLKLALNCVVNPLTALTRQRNKVVLSKNAEELVEIILDEFIQVARKHGYEFDKTYLKNYVYKNIELTRENMSSMLQDLLRGRKTEIDYINGFIARELGSPGLNYFITRLIHLIEGAGDEGKG